MALASRNESFEAPGFRPGLAEAQLDWPSVGLFSIRGGAEIRVRPAPGAALEELALAAAGPALAILLEQRGCAVLHGSCVAIGGSATAFLGASGVGKSTLAATLRDRGHPLISDGMTVIDVSEPFPRALPGPPHLKLWPDAIGSLKNSAVDTRPVVLHQEKRWYEASRGLCALPLPLQQIYLLEAGVGIESERIGPAAGLMGLVKNYFLADYADAQSGAFILRRCASVAGRVRVSTLRRGIELADLPAVLARIASAAVV